MPLLPLELFRQAMRMHPYHFWQLANSTVPVSSNCDTLVYEYAWQNADALGRADISAAIDTAEARLREWLGYSVAPHYVVETLDWPQYHDPSFWAWGPGGIDGRWRTLQLSEGYVQNFGIETRTIIQASAPVTYTDSDGDGVLDTFSVSVSTSILDAATLGIVFLSSDMPSTENDGYFVEAQRLHPVRVVTDGSDAVFTGNAWIMVKPKLYQGVAPVPLNPATAGVLATAVDVLQFQPGSTTAMPQATLIWNTLPWAGCAAPVPDSGSSRDPNAAGTATARVGISDARRGIAHVGQATYDATTGLWSAGSGDYWRPPDRVIVRYLAGITPGTPSASIVPINHDRMSPTWQTIVARLAAAELGQPICACQEANRELHYWQVDLARTGGNNDAQFGAISAEDLNNPFGTRRGHIYAWRQVNHLRLMRGLFAG